MQKKLKMLCTGGVGFIGTNLIKQLLKDGHEVHSLDNYSIGTVDNQISGCNYIAGDIDNIHLMDKDFDVCFHLASLSRIQPSFENPTETFFVNTVGTQYILEWARYTNTKVIYAGSSSRHHDPYQSPYATYKYLGEEICKLYKRTFNVNVEIARFYNVYGPCEIVSGKWAALIGLWRYRVKNNLPLEIVGDGEQRRDFTHVDDIVDGLIKIAFSKETHNDAWELGTGVNYSINEVFDMFNAKFKVTAQYVKNQSGNYRETIRYQNDTLTRLGWKPTDKLKNYINNLTKL